jgi:nicotinate-nucleotide adenylyltransferase
MGKARSDNESMRIGILGGTYNPIHFGHLRAAEEIRKAFDLEKIIFIPSARPPHKEKEVIYPSHRFAMVNLAIEKNPYFFSSDVELKRQDKSYSIETINHFRQKYGKAEFFLILGTDAFLEIETWKNYKNLFSLCNFIVISRPGYGKRSGKDLLPAEISRDFSYDRKKKRYIYRGGFSTYFQKITLLDISSKKIRKYIREGKSIKYLLPEKVREYIAEHRLYGQD